VNIDQTTRVFAAAAGQYRAAGLMGTLPLPAGRKFPPPSGFTGATGRFPTDADIAAWSDQLGESFNLALRLPEDIIGIDVDAYDDKPGAATLADAEGRWGALPVDLHLLRT
jgi:Bifunctional DNA primase/polymerase, N-terminal